MLGKILAALFGFLDQIGQYLALKQSLDAGAAKQQVQAQQQVEANVQKADDAVSVRDDVRTERLRNRFDVGSPGYGNE